MANLGSLIRECSKPVLKGVKTKAYISPFKEISAFPRTREVIKLAASETPEQGDSKILDEVFTYETGGYHREIDILVDTGQVMNTLEGEIGGQENRGRFEFFVLGNTPAVKEWIDCLVDNSGCIHVAIPSKDGQMQSLGDPENPVFVESYEGGTGPDRVGYNVVLYSGFPRTNQVINVADYPLGLTPAA